MSMHWAAVSLSPPFTIHLKLLPVSTKCGKCVEISQILSCFKPCEGRWPSRCLPLCFRTLQGTGRYWCGVNHLLWPRWVCHKLPLEQWVTEAVEVKERYGACADKVIWLIKSLLFSQLEGVASGLSPEHWCPFSQWAASWHPVWQWEGHWLHSELHESVSVCGTSGVLQNLFWGRVRIWSPFRFHWISKVDYFLQVLDQQPIKIGK